MNIEAVDTARMPKASTIKGWTGGRGFIGSSIVR